MNHRKREEALQTNSYRDTILSYRVRFTPTRMDEGDRSAFQRPSRLRDLALPLVVIFSFGLLSSAALAQDWVKTGTSLGVEKVRLAVPDFKSSSSEPENAALLKTFNDTLWNDLDVSGVVELVSKSFYPLQIPGQPIDVNFPAWNAPPPNAAMLAFGSLGVAGGKLTVQGWLYDVKNTQSPQVLGKQYTDTSSDAAARMMAHKFADEIIFRLGGGITGHRRDPTLFRERPDRAQRNLGDGLRWFEPAPDYASGFDLVITPHLARWFPRCLQQPDQDWLGDHDVFA